MYYMFSDWNSSNTGFTKMLVPATTSGHAQLNYCYILNAWVMLFNVFIIFYECNLISPICN